MDKLSQLKQALDEILDDDRVTRMDDGSYEVLFSRYSGGGEFVWVRNDGLDWTAYFSSGHAMPGAPRHERPNEVVAWALQ
jgi:hypothetical protein